MSNKVCVRWNLENACDSLYSVAVQGSCHIQAVATLHGSNSGLHDFGRTQH